MSTKPTEVKCDKCGAEFEAVPHRARKGELRAEYLQCPECYAIYPAVITDRALRKLLRDTSPAGYKGFKQRRMQSLKKQHGESLKAMDGWEEER